MTVASATARKSFTGDAATTSFATSPMVFFDDADLTVYVVVTATGVSETLVLDTDYTVSGGAGSTGTVDLSGGSSPYGAPAATQTVVIVREVAMTQSSDLINNDTSDAEVVEDALDRLTMIAQQNDARIDRAFILADDDVTGVDLTMPTPAASELLGFNAAGDALTTYPVASIVGTVVPTAYMETLLDDATATEARATLDTFEDVFTTAGDLLYGGASGAETRLAAGTARQQLAMNSGATAPTWVASLQSLMTAQGDIVQASAANTPARLAIGTKGQSLRVNSGATAAEWTAAWVFVPKTADETVNNSTALQDDGHLTFSGSNGDVYAAKFVIDLLAANATGDFKFDFNSLAGNTSAFRLVWRAIGGDGVVTGDVDESGAGSDISVTSANNKMRIEIDLNFTLSAGASCTLRWAQNTADPTDSTVTKGSYLEYIKIA